MCSQHYRIRVLGLIYSVGRILLLFLLASCTNQSTLPIPTEIPPGQWLVTFLNGPTCQPPCWENIMPGKTPIKNAVEILESKKDVVNLKTEGPIEGPQFDQRVDVLWDFSDDRSGGWIISDGSGEVVLQIKLSPQALQLYKIIDKYGEPEQVLMQQPEWTSWVDIYIIYLRINMILETNLIAQKGLIELAKGQNISRISFNQDGSIEEFIKRLTPSPLSNIVKWHGYGGYEIPQH